jgi:hypothetical protein
MEAYMQTLKQEAISALSSLPDTATVEDMMYRLYVIDKIHIGQEAAQRGEVISAQDLLKEVESW